MELETYRGLYIDFSGLPWAKIEKEWSRIRVRHPYLGPDVRYIYRVGSYKPPTREKYEQVQREKEEFRASSQERLRQAAAAMGKVGGSSKSSAKQAASRENGKKGGRPRRSADTDTVRRLVD